MTIALLLSAALALPCRAVISHGEAPDPVGPSAPISREFPTASVLSISAASNSDAPQLPAAALDPAESRAGEVGQAMGQVSEQIAPGLETARQGEGDDAATAGQTIIAALEGAKVVARPHLDPALDTSSAQAASYRYAYASAAEAAKGARLPKPRFFEAWREKDGWTFHFVAGGRHIRVYARDGHQPADRAWIGAEFQPDASLGLSPARFGQKFGPKPRWALKEAAKRFDVPESALGLSIVTLPRSKSLWYLVDAEDGRRVAFNAESGKVEPVDSGFGREKVEASARALAGQKGYPYSRSEYNAAYAGYVDMLRQDGATRAQLALFERLMAETPVKGGRFNSWSGD